MDSIFENMTDKEFEKMLNDSGFSFTKVEKGKGGLIVAGSPVTDSMIRDEYEKLKVYAEGASMYCKIKDEIDASDSIDVFEDLDNCILAA